VITDYIEKVAADRRQLQLFGNSPTNREADNVEQLKNFGEACEVPILMLAQATKEGKGKKDVEDMGRNDMRGAGEKSEKANLVIKLHREKSPDGEKGDNGEYIIQPNGYSRITTILVDKQTLGATGSFEQIMEPQFFRLLDLARIRTLRR
jgi:replicative DNA helicase